MPAVIGLFALVQVVYYGVLGATRQHPLQSIMVFDLGGISHFTKENQFPVTWTEPETALLLNGCYQPTEWDIYWRLEPCQFVMHKARTRGKAVRHAGDHRSLGCARSRAIRSPICEHRAAFMWNFLGGANLTMWVADIDDPTKPCFRTVRPLSR